MMRDCHNLKCFSTLKVVKTPKYLINHWNKWLQQNVESMIYIFDYDRREGSYG